MGPWVPSIGVTCHGRETVLRTHFHGFKSCVGMEAHVGGHLMVSQPSKAKGGTDRHLVGVNQMK